MGTRVEKKGDIEGRGELGEHKDDKASKRLQHLEIYLAENGGAPTDKRHGEGGSPTELVGQLGERDASQDKGDSKRRP